MQIFTYDINTVTELNVYVPEIHLFWLSYSNSEIPILKVTW